MLVEIAVVVIAYAAGVVTGKNLGAKAKAEIATVSADVKKDAAAAEKKL